MDQLQNLLGQVFGQPKRKPSTYWHITWPDGRKGRIYKEGSTWWYDVPGGRNGCNYISAAKADVIALGGKLERRST